MRRATKGLALVGAWAVLQLGVGGCFYDYGALTGPKAAGPGTGGQANTGGHTATGGSGPGTGGGGTGGRATGTGGAGSMGGASAGGSRGTGGSPGTGGGPGTGGSPGTGGMTSAGGAGAGGAAGATVEQMEPVLWYKFDEETGTTVADSGTGSGAPRHGALMTFGTGGGVGFSTTKVVGTHAATLTGNQATGGGYVVLPPLVDVAPGAVTLSAWVYPTVNHDWMRVFNFAVSQSVYMFLTINQGQDANDYVRFGITLMGNTAEQRLNTTVALGLNQWHHLVVVLNAGSPYTGTLYVDGVQAGTNTAMTLHASDLGATSGNYLGRSTFTADWYYSGHIDDFRIYNRALGAAEVTALFGQR